MNVIAERDKTLGKILLALGSLLIVGSAWLITNSFWYALSLVLGVFLFCFAFYQVILLPKSAIIKDGDALIICYAFRQKRINVSALEYVSYNELGEFRSRHGGLFSTLYIFKKDIRRLTVTLKENGELKHYCVWSILYATAVATSIQGFIEEAKKQTERENT